MPVLKVRFNHRSEEKKYYYKVQGHSFQICKKKKKKIIQHLCKLC